VSSPQSQKKTVKTEQKTPEKKGKQVKSVKDETKSRTPDKSLTPEKNKTPGSPVSKGNTAKLYAKTKK